MIINLPDTTVSQINRRLVTAREEGGAVALSRVLTLVIDANDCDIEPSIEAANAASHEHPCRVIVLSHDPETEGKLNAELRLGRDAGASEVIVLRHSEVLSNHLDTLVLPLLLPDAPVVIYWPHKAPINPSKDTVGQLGQRRITDSRSDPRGIELLMELRDNYSPGDTDLAWTRTTLWRSRIAATLDQPPYEPVLRACVAGEKGHPSIDLLSGWLALRLGCPVTMELIEGAPGLTEVRLERESGTIVLSRPSGDIASFLMPGEPKQRISLPMRSLGDALAEDLRQLDSDQVYGDTLREGLSLVEGK